VGNFLFEYGCVVVSPGVWLVVDEEFLLPAITSNKNAFDWRRKEDFFFFEWERFRA
jgi:hypothetical protein